MDGDGPCNDCGTHENPVWYTDNVFWNEVLGEQRNLILCLYCFVRRAEADFDITAWRVSPDWKWQRR